MQAALNCPMLALLGADMLKSRRAQWLVIVVLLALLGAVAWPDSDVRQSCLRMLSSLAELGNAFR